MKKIKSFGLLGIIMFMSAISCTNLDEEPFSILTKQNYYSDERAIDAAVLRVYDQMQWVGYNTGATWQLTELTADHFVWTQKGRHGQDDGMWVRLHNHIWTDDDNRVRESWNNCFAGIGQANMALRDFQTLDFESLGISEDKQALYTSELRGIRAWFYLLLFDNFREIPIFTDQHPETALLAQSSPKDVFEFIESEIKAIVPSLPKEAVVGHITQASAMGILMRLYFNAETYGQGNRFTDCKKICEDIINGIYGTYSINQDDYRDPFRSGLGGYRSPELLLEFPHQRNTMNFGEFWGSFMHYSARDIFGVSDGGNNGIHLQPSRDHESTTFIVDNDGKIQYTPGNIYQHASGLGNPFEKYPDGDKRKVPFKMKKGGGDYDGFFLQGQQFKFDRGTADYTTVPVTGTEEYLDKPLMFIDVVGRFTERNNTGGRWGEGSRVQTGEENSGIRFNKFPYLSEVSGLWHSQSAPEMRLAEVYYTLAEIHYREGDKPKAAELLDYIRKRNYTPEDWSKFSYVADLSKLTDQEFIDEWGREFLGERRRRIDLVRWGRFGDAWWDKVEDTRDNKIFPIPRRALETNPLMKQTTPGF